MPTQICMFSLWLCIAPTKTAHCRTYIMFIYSEKATKFCEISTVDLSYIVPVKSTIAKFVAFSKYINFTYQKQFDLTCSIHSDIQISKNLQGQIKCFKFLLRIRKNSLHSLLGSFEYGKKSVSCRILSSLCST